MCEYLGPSPSDKVIWETWQGLHRSPRQADLEHTYLEIPTTNVVQAILLTLKKCKTN